MRTEKLLNAARRIAAFGAAPAAPLPEGEFSAPAKAPAEYFTAGFGKAPVLPEDIDTAKYYIAGYRENNPARGVLDPQYAHALWLDDNSGRGGVLFVSLDAVGLLNKDVAALRAFLTDFRVASGCRAVNVFCTHDHAGIDTMGLWGPLPRTGKNKKFMRLLFRGVKEAAFQAFAARRAGQLYLGQAEVPEMQEDIRLPQVFSKTLTRLRFVPADGSNEIWWVNFAAHSESLQGCNSLVSADFPAYFRARVLEEAGAETLYTVGAVGGMISMKIENEALLRKEHRLPENTRAIGRRLAEYALNLTEETRLAPRLDFIRREFYVPVENSLLTLAGMAGVIAVNRYCLPGGGLAVKSELTYMVLGDLPLLFLPGEFFPELVYGGALEAAASATGRGPEANPPTLTDIAGDERLLVFGLANDELGYVIPPNDFYLHPEKPYLEKGIDRHSRRHYEETNSAGPLTAAAFAEAFRKAMEKARKE